MFKVPGQTPQGPTRSGTRPLVFMVVVFLVMIGAMIMLETEDPEREPIPTVENRAEEDFGDVEPDTVPWDPKTETWGIIEDADPARRFEVPVKALKAAAVRISDRPWARFKLSGDFERLVPEKVLTQPAQQRGRAMEVVGELISLEAVDLFDRFGFKLGKMVDTYQGVIRARARVHGSPVAVKFLMVDETPGGLPVVIGDEVKLQGVFFKLHEDELGDPPERETTIWLLAKRIYMNYRIPEPDEVDLSILQYVEDDEVQADAKQHFFLPPLFHLMGSVYHGDLGELAKDPIELKGKTVRKLLESPEEYRGKLIEFQGRVIRREYHPMEVFFEQNAQGDNLVGDVWNTYITPDGTVPVTVMWINEPQKDITFQDQVKVRGIFYRVWGYKASGDRWIKAPLMLGLGDIEVLDINKPDPFGPLALGVLAFAGVVVVIMFIVLRADRRKGELFRQKRAARRQVRRGAVDLNEVAREAGETPDETPETAGRSDGG